jgi:cytochrome c biogenesis protein CcdA/thiol-disulfide isomerase/thioredoxin
MITTIVTLFTAGLLTILLPCILPLVPIVLGVSIAGRNKWRPLLMTAGMVLSFVMVTFIVQVFLVRVLQGGGAVLVDNLIRTSTYYILLLFGICFLTSNVGVQVLVAVLGAWFYHDSGLITMLVAAVFGVTAVTTGGRIAAHIQQLGSDVQQSARSHLGESLLSTFVIGMTLGLVWVPCAGPALGYALALVRDEPGSRAFIALAAYALGAGVPLLLIGYGGQKMVTSARSIGRYSGIIKHVAGAIFVVSAIAFQFQLFTNLQTWLVNNTSFGTLGTRLEESFLPDLGTQDLPTISSSSESSSDLSSSVTSTVSSSVQAATSSRQTASSRPSLASSSTSPMPKQQTTSATPEPSPLPKIIRAPEFAGLGPWHNSSPLTLAGLKGKVVLVDFWTYSCINCIRTLPYIQGYWDRFKSAPFVVLGVHSPEFVFEQDEKNVADAIKRHGLTYPIAQDNAFGTWRAFANRYWPAKYLIDADGYVRYTHFGEGGYEETADAIASLLREAGAAVPPKISAPSTTAGSGRQRSPETYLGERSWPSFSNALGDPDENEHQYVVSTDPPLNKYALSGTWQLIDGEYEQLSSSEGEIHYTAQASEVNLVLGLATGASPVEAQVYVDGTLHKTFTVDRHDLFNLYTGAYTFGS